MSKRTTQPDSAAPALAPAASRASSEGTARYARRFRETLGPDSFREGLSGLTLSSVGLGTYLGECTDAEDERYVAAIRRALASGINVLDTAINYRCQRSERDIGTALRAAIAEGTVSRDEVVVCTKGGFLPLEGAPPVKRSEYERYVRGEFFETGVLSPDDVVGGGHSLAPSFLRYSIARSRRNLGIGTIDLYYLHNPEQQLATVSHPVLHERLRTAFATLEEAVAQDQIAAYGCATWNALRRPPGTKGHLNLAELVGVAREVAGDRHHLVAVQLPISLAMPEALRAPTQRLADGRTVTVLEAAEALGLSVFASAPLAQGQLTSGLPEAVHALFPDAHTDAQRALSFVRSLSGVATALVGMKDERHVVENLR